MQHFVAGAGVVVVLFLLNVTNRPCNVIGVLCTHIYILLDVAASCRRMGRST